MFQVNSHSVHFTIANLLYLTGYLVKDEEACVIKCPEGKQADPKTHVCVDCGGTCPKGK